MYGPTDLKKNTLITLDGQPYKVIEYSQKVMGRGGSIVNVRVKNLITGALIPLPCIRGMSLYLKAYQWQEHWA